MDYNQDKSKPAEQAGFDLSGTFGVFELVERIFLSRHHDLQGSVNIARQFGAG